MDLALDDEQVAVAELARTLAAEVVAPAAREADRDGTVPQAVWTKLLDSGLTVAVAESAGGGGLPGDLSQQLIAQHLAYGDPGIAMAAMWSAAATRLVARHGSAQQQKLLSGRASDPSWRSGLALYEGFGRGLEELATTISVDGDMVRVTGTKVAVAFAAIADPLVVVGRDPQSGALRVALVPSSADGVDVGPTTSGLALGAAQLATVRFDVTLPATVLLGGADLGVTALGAEVQGLRLLVASALLGTARHSVDYAATYASERVAFGQPIGSFQGVSFPMAESLMRIEAARLEVADLVTSRAGRPAESFDFAVGRAIAYASTISVDATRHGVQALGGHGYMEDHPVELWYRSATALAALDFDPVCVPFQPAL